MRAVAVVGYGYWGQNLVRVLTGRGDTVVVVVDSDEARHASLAQRFPGVAAVGELDEVLDRVDAVVIATPPASHMTLVGDALRAGCDVFVEKPFTTTSADGEELMALAADRDRVLMVGHTYDYHPVTHELARRFQEGDLGRIRYLDSARLSMGGYRDDVNVLWDMAPHDIVIMRRVLDRWPSRVSAWCIDHSGFGMPDVGIMRLEFEDPDTVGYIRVSWLDPAKVRRFTVVGDKRTAMFNDVSDPAQPLRIIDTSAEARLGAGARHPLPPGYDPALVSAPSVPVVEPLATELDHFLHCVATRREPYTSAAEGLAVVRVLEAADQSALSGTPVTVDPVPAAIRRTVSL
jgi:predicted dehydrogenase